MPGKVTHSESSQERKWNRIKNGTGWGLKQEKEVRERKPNCLKRPEVISPITDFLFFKKSVKYIYCTMHIYTHVCMYVYMHVFMKSSFFLVEKRHVHRLPKLPAEVFVSVQEGINTVQEISKDSL